MMRLQRNKTPTLRFSSCGRTSHQPRIYNEKKDANCQQAAGYHNHELSRNKSSLM